MCNRPTNSPHRSPAGSSFIDLQCAFPRPIEAPTHFHGSTSAALPPILSEGLHPSGELLRMGKVLFGGELHYGLLPRGINLTSVSAVDGEGVQGALIHADLLASRPWTPEIGRKRIQHLEECLREEVSDPRDREALLLKLEIEKTRALKWPRLDPREQAFISAPFPVLYGIQGGEVRIPQVQSDTAGEVGIEAVAPNRLVVFVPECKVGQVRAFMDSVNSPAPLRPADALYDFVNSASVYDHRFHCAMQGFVDFGCSNKGSMRGRGPLSP